jgi:hypothetical protein
MAWFGENGLEVGEKDMGWSPHLGSEAHKKRKRGHWQRFIHWPLKGPVHMYLYVEHE